MTVVRPGVYDVEKDERIDISVSTTAGHSLLTHFLLDPDGWDQGPTPDGGKFTVHVEHQSLNAQFTQVDKEHEYFVTIRGHLGGEDKESVRFEEIQPAQRRYRFRLKKAPSDG